MLIGVVRFGFISDTIVRRKKAKEGPYRPEIRLTPALTVPSGLALSVRLFIYGWTEDKAVFCK
jgi:hypothetical protein